MDRQLTEVRNRKTQKYQNSVNVQIKKRRYRMHIYCFLIVFVFAIICFSTPCFKRYSPYQECVSVCYIQVKSVSAIHLSGLYMMDLLAGSEEYFFKVIVCVITMVFFWWWSYLFF